MAFFYLVSFALCPVDIFRIDATFSAVAFARFANLSFRLKGCSTPAVNHQSVKYKSLLTMLSVSNGITFIKHNYVSTLFWDQ